MTMKVKLSADKDMSVDLVLQGPPKAVKELVQRLRMMGGPVSVAGGPCCWTLSREGTTFHVVLDSEKVA